ncbi:MAG: IPT/TIG domain-containing protein [Bryobacterales bacterium]|nr:IPT/TIG domain-containing protein [Bryobacterales bacterium]
MTSFKLSQWALAAALLPVLWAQTPMPRMVSVEPTSGKVGDVLTVTGENLEKAHVAEVFLTDGKNDLKVPVTEQAATTLKFRIPPNVKPGKWALMILTTGKDPKYIEQPVKVTVESAESAKPEATSPEQPKAEEQKAQPAPRP